MDRKHFLLSGVIIIIAVFVLLELGRVAFCECGTITLWGGIYLSNEMSQQFGDIYTPSHFLHGIGFYWLLRLLRRKLRMSTGTMLVVAVVLEALWEIFENTSFIINRYREVTISYDYYGDSVFNSVGDILAMIVGFLFALRFPGWVSLAAVVAVEFVVLYLIRDNLTLNIIMLLHPFDSILEWQRGG